MGTPILGYKDNGNGTTTVYDLEDPSVTITLNSANVSDVTGPFGAFIVQMVVNGHRELGSSGETELAGVIAW